MLILASGSPRRREILRELGLSFQVEVPDTEEIILPDDPRGTARKNAREKLQWCRERHPDRSIIAADTVIDFEGGCLVKPSSRREAFSFLSRFSGRTQSVITAVALARPDEAVRVEEVESRVLFRKLDESQIEEYFRHVDPMDKAGAYDINQSSELIIESFSGSWTNIMGLPVEVIKRWLGTYEGES